MTSSSQDLEVVHLHGSSQLVTVPLKVFLEPQPSGSATLQAKGVLTSEDLAKVNPCLTRLGEGFANFIRAKPLVCAIFRDFARLSKPLWRFYSG